MTGAEDPDTLVREIAARRTARDPAGAARLRLRLASALRDARRWGDAVESAERARRELDRAGLTAEAAVARYLLVELYGEERGHQEEIHALLDELLAVDPLPESLPPRAALLERAARHGRTGRRIELLTEAADRYRAAGDGAAESRVVQEILRVATVPADPAALVSRMDGLIAAGLVDERSLPSIQAELCRLEGETRPEAALERARRHPGDHAGLRIREAFLLLRLGRHAEAEETARRWATGEDGLWFWEACVIVTRSLRERGRPADAVAFLARHGLQPSDLDDVYLD
ncbi:hypothetical protein [Actinoplanes flavus]|uniref:Tetratricopeptide repeat protein n=1 Tax=Actinoplanes flavus TaxID=2820290 RepID=A0ABS3UV41_9ACTN|nr:hypothetical protein [Actinoplanes flavus]MBO3742443.1 hypothetical protein [Actinoplanes flavus]